MSDVKFEITCGQNVSLKKNRKEVTWVLDQSGGWVYSMSPLVPDDTIKVVMKGSGHCNVGFVKENPGNPLMNGRMLKITKLNDIKIHKRTCELKMTLKKNGKELNTVFEGKYIGSKTGQSMVWVAVYVKFGNVSIQLISKAHDGNEAQLSFSSNHGSNICLKDGGHKAQTISNNPAACCFFKINPRETIELDCLPVTEGSRDPSRYSLQILATKCCPMELRRTSPQMFDTSAKEGLPPKLTSLELFEKVDCKGRISISLYDSSIIEYKTVTGKINRQQISTDSSFGLWVVLQLYRTTVRIANMTLNQRYNNKSIELQHRNDTRRRCETSEARPWNEKQTHQNGIDQIDGCVRDPLNCFSENSIDALNSLKDQEYVRYNNKSIELQHGNDIKRRCETSEARHGNDKQTHQNGIDQIDGCVRDPLNCFAENSIDVFNSLKDQEYVSVTEVKQLAQQSDNNDNTYCKYLPVLPEEPETDMEKVDEQSQMKTLLSCIEHLDQAKQEMANLLKDTAGVTDIPEDWFTHTDNAPVNKDEVALDTLKKNWTELVKNLRAESLCDSLFEYGIISHADMDEVLAINRTDQRVANRKLLTILGRKHVRKPLMLQVLEKTEEEHLKHLFFPDD